MELKKQTNLINIFIAIIIGCGLFFGVLALIFFSPSQTPAIASIPQVVTIAKPTATPTPEPTSIPEEQETTLDTGGFSIGSVVQIYNTEGAGLRLRSNPGTSSSVQFIGDELELFTVINGPTELDGYVWWYLESPYDTTRSGWAAAAYLQLIEESN